MFDNFVGLEWKKLTIWRGLNSARPGAVLVGELIPAKWQEGGGGLALRFDSVTGNFWSDKSPNLFSTIDSAPPKFIYRAWRARGNKSLPIYLLNRRIGHLIDVYLIIAAPAERFEGWATGRGRIGGGRRIPSSAIYHLLEIVAFVWEFFIFTHFFVQCICACLRF